MIRQKDLDLLSDLAKLLKKYGPESFERLRTLMTSGELPEKMADILATSKALARKKSSPRRTKRSIEKPEISIARQLSFLRESQPRKYDILQQFYKQAQVKQILATRRDVARLATELGLDISKRISREAILAKILQQLSSLPVEQLERRVKEIVERYKHETLEGWADIILKRRNNP